MKSINKILFSIGILLLTFTAFGQNTESENLPKKDIKVNKEYDEDGKLIRYDSSYVYSWSSDSTKQFFNDSAFFNQTDMNRVHKRMQEQLSRFLGSDSMRQKNNKHPFFSDDFFKDDFFGNDFFDSKMFRRNFHQADSSRNDFFKELEEMMNNRRQFRQEHNSKMQRELDSLRNDFLEQRREYYQKRDSIYRKHNGMHNKTIDL